MFQQGFNGFLRIVMECFTLMTWRLCNQSTGLKSIWFSGILLKRTERRPTVTELHCSRKACSHTWYLLLVTHSSLHMPASDSAGYAVREQQCSSTGFRKDMVIHVCTAYFQGLFPSHTVQCSTPFALFIQPWVLIPYWQRIRIIFGQPNSLRYNQGPYDLSLLE